MTKELINNNRKVLEEFLIDIDILDKLEKEVSNFNTFETLGVIYSEIRHSNVLSWLLTPTENHGLGDYFIKKFVQKVIYNHRDIDTDVDFDILQISLMDYHDVIIRREWKNIDLLAVSTVNKFVIAIENKIWSGESNHQLEKYYKIVQNEFKDYHKLFVFLTPFGDESSNPDTWLSFNYGSILSIINKGIELHKESMSERVRLFTIQYIDMVRRYIVGDDDLRKVCHEIYFKHKKALDLIFEYKPDIYSDISDVLQEYIRGKENLILDDSGKIYIRFTTKKLDKLIEKSGENWISSKRVLIFEIQNKGNKLDLKLLIGPGDNRLRERLYHHAIENKDIFKGINHRFSPQFTQIYSEDILPMHFDEEMEHEEILKIASYEFDMFIKKRLNKIEESFLNLYESNLKV